MGKIRITPLRIEEGCIAEFIWFSIFYLNVSLQINCGYHTVGISRKVSPYGLLQHVSYLFSHPSLSVFFFYSCVLLFLTRICPVCLYLLLSPVLLHHFCLPLLSFSLVRLPRLSIPTSTPPSPPLSALFLPPR